MSVTIGVCTENGRAWSETMDVPNGQDPVEYAKRIIREFNDDLRGSAPRKLTFIQVDPSMSKYHTWDKTNLVTITKGGGVSYDTVKCTICGVTGKRYGIGNGETIDPKWRAEHWKRCDTAVAALVKAGKMEQPEIVEAPIRKRFKVKW